MSQDLLFAMGFLGLLIGVLAAKKKGFSVVGGALGGLILGPLAVLLFLVSGDRRKCPNCAEMISKEAKVCPKCRCEVVPAVNQTQRRG